MTTIEPPREQTRARYPDEDGYVERDGVRVFYEVYGTGDRRSCCCPPGRSSTRATGRRRSPTCPATPRGHVRRARERPHRTARRRRAYAEREFAADAIAVMDATGTDRAVWSGSRPAACGARCSPPSTRSASPARCSSRPPRRSPSTSRARPRRSTSRSSPTRAGPSTTSTTGSRTTATSSSSSSARCSPSRTRPSRSRTASAGRSRPTPRRSLTYLGRELNDASAFARARRASRARCSSSTAPTTRSRRSWATPSPR